MENNEGKDNNSEEELEQNTLNKKFVKRIKKKKIVIDTEKIPSIIEALHYFLSELKTLEKLQCHDYTAFSDADKDILRTLMNSAESLSKRIGVKIA